MYQLYLVYNIYSCKLSAVYTQYTLAVDRMLFNIVGYFKHVIGHVLVCKDLK